MFSIANELDELGAPFAGVTPGLNCTRSNTLRVSSGTRSIVSAVMSWPTVELLGSTRSTAALSVTTSEVAPTRNAMLTTVI